VVLAGFFLLAIFRCKIAVMKKISFLFLIFIAFSAFSQNCGDYYYFQNNKTIEISIANKKGKETGKLVYTISDVTKKGSATVSTIHSEMFDKNGKSTSKGTNNLQCENGIVMMDMKMFIPTAQQEQMGEMSATGSTNYLEYPSSMKEGDALKDASFSMDFKSTSGINSHISMDMTNRKVSGKENVTTPAGTWNCYKINYHSKMIFKMGIGIPMNFDVTELFEPGFEVVKTESNGGTTQVTAIK